MSRRAPSRVQAAASPRGGDGDGAPNGAVANGEPDVASCVGVSRLIGGDPALVLHGSGNTSVKTTVTDRRGGSRRALWIKTSGSDLAAADARSFTALDLEPLRALLARDHLDELEMVDAVRLAMLDPAAPMPSIETLTHAALPHRYVLHAHPDAVLAVTSVPAGARAARRIFGSRYAIVPWAQPGFALARAVDRAWQRQGGRELRGMVLLHHGILAFAEDAQTALEALADCVELAEAALPPPPQEAPPITSPWSRAQIANLRRAVSRLARRPMDVVLDDSPTARGFAALPHAAALGRRGPLSACHVGRTRRAAAFVPHADGADDALARYAAEHRRYFDRFADGRPLAMLDPAPRVVIAPGAGVFACGADAGEAAAVRDLFHHAIPAILAAERLGGYRPLSARQTFELEYRPLEQQRLVRDAAPSTPPAPLRRPDLRRRAVRQPLFPPRRARDTHPGTGGWRGATD
jgi:rhamnose utilization protein RhaD (predicted bifunctional aldolase and dehydrogenase)